MGEVSTMEKDGKIIVMEARCTGHCCSNVTFRFSPAEFQSFIESYKKQDEWDKNNPGGSSDDKISQNRPSTSWKRDDGKVIYHNYSRKELEYIVDMLIYKGPSPTDPADGKKIQESILKEGEVVKSKDGWENWQLEWAIEKGMVWNDKGELCRHTYTCKYFDGKSCTSYQDRPQVCREYPLSGNCKYTECTGSCKEK